METITRTYEVYEFSELSDKAKQVAYMEWLKIFDYAYSDDNMKTLEKFTQVFNITIVSWQYDSCTYNYRFISHYRGEEEELNGIRLLKYLINNYYSALFIPKSYWLNGNGFNKTRKSQIFVQNDAVLTGYCADYAILKPIYNFLKGPTNLTLYNLIDKCLDNFFRFCRDDLSFQLSEESCIGDCEMNDYKFLSDGKMFN